MSKVHIVTRSESPAQSSLLGPRLAVELATYSWVSPYSLKLNMTSKKKKNPTALSTNIAFRLSGSRVIILWRTNQEPPFSPGHIRQPLSWGWRVIEYRWSGFTWFGCCCFCGCFLESSWSSKGSLKLPVPRSLKSLKSGQAILSYSQGVVIEHLLLWSTIK